MSILSLVVDAHVDEQTLLDFEREDLKDIFDGMIISCSDKN